MFYPLSPTALRSEIEGYLSQVEPLEGPSPKAIIVPHAGTIYSGPIAASAYAQLDAGLIRRVVLLGPAHRVFLCGLAAPEAAGWETPLGRVAVDHAALNPVRESGLVLFSDEAHEAEHSLEVQVPFLQVVLNEFQLVPLVAGDASAEDVSQVLETLWGGSETLIVISSDLSHYESYEKAREQDRRTANAISHLEEDELGPADACGRVGVRGLLYLAKKKGLRPKLLDLRSSGDTAGPRDQVVGYGAWAFYS
jgi:AmmeMemoRadiSam system protein B